MNRGTQQPQNMRPHNANSGSNSGATPNTIVSSGGGAKKITTSGGSHKEPGWIRIANVLMLFALTVLGVGVASLLYFGNPSEAKYVANDKYQAVFLTNGQVYFGKIRAVSPRFVDLQSIYYLSSQQAQPDTSKDSAANNNKFSLVKLGCELHGPYDQMIINRDQVTFWENLKDDGQVAKAISSWVQQNPNGQQCSTSTSNTSDSSSSTTDTSKSSTTANTPATTDTTKKP